MAPPKDVRPQPNTTTRETRFLIDIIFYRRYNRRHTICGRRGVGGRGMKTQSPLRKRVTTTPKTPNVTVSNVYLKFLILKLMMNNFLCRSRYKLRWSFRKYFGGVVDSPSYVCKTYFSSNHKIY